MLQKGKLRSGFRKVRWSTLAEKASKLLGREESRAPSRFRVQGQGDNGQHKGECLRDTVLGVLLHELNGGH